MYIPVDIYSLWWEQKSMYFDVTENEDNTTDPVMNRNMRKFVAYMTSLNQYW
jgi:hypothetical protein